MAVIDIMKFNLKANPSGIVGHTFFGNSGQFVFQFMVVASFNGSC